MFGLENNISSREDLERTPGINRTLLFAGLLIAALVAYLPGINSFYYYKDFFWLVRMANISKNGLDDVFFVLEIPCQILFYLDFQYFHMSPEADNVILLLLHVICAYAVFETARKLTGDVLIGAVSSFIFCLHPAGVASIFVKNEIRCIVAALLALIAFNFYIKHGVRGRAGDYVWSAVCLFLSILSFNGTASLFTVFFAYDVLVKRNTLSLSSIRKWIGKNKAIVIPCVATIVIRGIFLDEASLFKGGKLLENLCGAIQRLFWIFASFLVPQNSIVGSVTTFAITVSLGIFILIILISVIRRGRTHIFLFLWMFFVAFPMVADPEIRSDFILLLEYSYIPRIGFSIFAAMVLIEAVSRVKERNMKLATWIAVVEIAVAMVVACRQASTRFELQTEPMRRLYKELRSTPDIFNAPVGANLYFLNFPVIQGREGGGLWPVPFLIRVAHSDPVKTGSTIRQHYIFGNLGYYLIESPASIFTFDSYTQKLHELKGLDEMKKFLSSGEIYDMPVHSTYFVGDIMNPKAKKEDLPIHYNDPKMKFTYPLKGGPQETLQDGP